MRAMRGLVVPFALVVPWFAHAATVAPSNLPAGFCDVPQTTDFTPVTNRTFDTDTECTSVVTQAGADICVVRFRQIAIPSGVSIGATGTRLLALTASTNFVLQGTVNFVGNSPAQQPAAGGSGASRFGAAGGGHGANGGTGGNAGAIGAPAAGNATLVPLTNGSRGGSAASGGPGGAGGGAIQLVACGDFLIDASANVLAMGLGGIGGSGGAVNSDGLGGAGGGSGGGILIEGDNVDVLGKLSANGGAGAGGGGGGGFSSSGDPGGPGGAGTSSIMPAAGGVPGTGSGAGGRGGDGGVAGPGSSGQNGADGMFGDGGGGGGGGAPGRIRINSCSTLDNTPAVASPPPTFGSSCDRLLVNGFE